MTSKVQQQKDKQGYVSAPACCGTCANYLFNLATIAGADNYSPPREVEKNKRCKIGWFAVNKTAHCRLYERNTTSTIIK